MADYNVKEIAFGGNNYKMYPANLTSETQFQNAAQDATETQDRVYPVRLDANGKLAVNVPWTDSGGSGLTEDIAKLKSDIGIVEDTDVATHAIASGQYVIWHGELYKASSAIAVDDALSLSNLTAVSGGGLNDIVSNHAWKLKTFGTPIGTNTINSRQRETVNELNGAKEVIICVKTSTSSSISCYQSHFIDYGENSYSDYFYQRPPDNNYSILYDVQWIPSENEINIRYNYKGTSVTSTGYPKIFAVMYR